MAVAPSSSLFFFRSALLRADVETRPVNQNAATGIEFLARGATSLDKWSPLISENSTCYVTPGRCERFHAGYGSTLDLNSAPVRSPSRRYDGDTTAARRREQHTPSLLQGNRRSEERLLRFWPRNAVTIYREFSDVNQLRSRFRTRNRICRAAAKRNLKSLQRFSPPFPPTRNTGAKSPRRVEYDCESVFGFSP